jgi:hypothetical protein
MTEGASRNDGESLKLIDWPGGTRKGVLMQWYSVWRWGLDSSGTGNVQWWSLVNITMNRKVSGLVQDFQLPRRSLLRAGRRFVNLRKS